MVDADLVHIYRALKLLKDIIEESPELVTDAENEQFMTAWGIVNNEQIRRYIYEDTDPRY